MRPDSIRRYVWLIDTLSKYGQLTRSKISDLWQKSPMSDGRPLAERTFHHHRRAIEENFHIDIRCNSFGEYYIDNPETPQEMAFRNWLLNSYSLSDTLSDTPSTAEYVLVEDVPSSREFLPIVIEAIRGHQCITFTYAGFTRSRAEAGIEYAPYFVRLYKQRWYMVGEKMSNRQVRTYALDRVKEMHLSERPAPPHRPVEPRSYFRDCIGVTVPRSKVHLVRLRVDPIRAKYLRALPFHDSQRETATTDKYSIFSYDLKLNYELVHEILAMGPQVTVLSPNELRIMLVEELHRSLSNYVGKRP